MRWRLTFVGICALLFVLAGLAPFTATARAVGPASVAPRAAIVSGPPRIVKKVILDDWSIDGPSLWQPNIVSGAPGTGPGMVLAWTGSDYRLNTMLGDALLTFRAKHIYNESSFYRPAVTTVSGSGTIYLAWTGTNAARSLNVLCSSCGSNGGPRKLTLWSETSFTAPALAADGNKLWLAWTGTDANHSLNVLPIDPDTLAPGGKTILRQFSSVASPALRPDPNTKGTLIQGLLLSWAGTSPLDRIRFATSTDGVNWTEPSTSPLGETSAAAPDMLALKITNWPRYFLAWAGTDPHNSLNARYTNSFPNWPLDNTKTTFGEWAFGAPAIAFDGSTDPSQNLRQLCLAWSGTDRIHHLNVALVRI